MSGLYDAPSLLKLNVSTFKGIDVSVPEDQQKPYRAADAKNMMPDATGEARKRPGFHFKAGYFYVNMDGRERTLCRVIDNKLFIVKVAGTDTLSEFYILYMDTIKIATMGKMPVVIPQNERYVVFMLGGTNAEGARIATDSNYTYRAAMAVVESNTANVYASNFRHYSYDGDSWAIGLIGKDEIITPIILQGCDPTGGGSPYQQVNLLNPWVTESFYVKDKACVFYLNSVPVVMSTVVTAPAPLPGVESTEKITVGPVEGYDPAGSTRYGGDALYTTFTVEELILVDEKESSDSDEVVQVPRWVKRPLGSNDGYRPSANRLFLSKDHNKDLSYTTDYGETIKVNGGAADNGWIGASPIEGEDNIRITYPRHEFSEQLEALCNCICGTWFGVAGHKDRLFIGGCGEKKNRVYYSELENPCYIGDLNYIETEPGSKVLALDGTADTLAILTDRGIYFSSGAAQNNADATGFVADVTFAITSRIPAPGVKEGGGSAVFGGEIVYLSDEGVIAVASGDNYDSRYAEHRSAMFNKAMLADNPRQLISAGRYLLIQCDNDICWLMDEHQPTADGNKPYSTRQFEGYRLAEIKGTLYEENNTIYSLYGDKVYQWMDGTAGEHYHDEWDNIETAIEAYWETPWLYGNSFFHKKVFTTFGILLGQVNDADTAVDVDARRNADDWKDIMSYDGTLCSYDYRKIDYRLFTYAPAPGCPAITVKIKIKKALRVKLRFRNDFINQPLILREFGLNYVSES